MIYNNKYPWNNILITYYKNNIYYYKTENQILYKYFFFYYNNTNFDKKTHINIIMKQIIGKLYNKKINFTNIIKYKSVDIIYSKAPYSLICANKIKMPHNPQILKCDKYNMTYKKNAFIIFKVMKYKQGYINNLCFLKNKIKIQRYIKSRKKTNVKIKLYKYINDFNINRLNNVFIFRINYKHNDIFHNNFKLILIIRTTR